MLLWTRRLSGTSNGRLATQGFETMEQRTGVHLADHPAGRLVDQTLGDAQSDPAAASGDEGDFAFKSLHNGSNRSSQYAHTAAAIPVYVFGERPRASRSLGPFLARLGCTRGGSPGIFG